MRIELEVLRFALSIDMKKPYQPSKQKKPKKEKKKKGKKKQRKSLEDVMEGRSVDECYEELVKLNVGLDIIFFRAKKLKKFSIR